MPEALLSVTGLAVGYGAIEVLHGIDLEVGPGEIIAVLGSNGAGKSTLNRTISGVLRATHGSIRFASRAIEREKPAMIVARGLIHVPEGRRVFPNLTISISAATGAPAPGARRTASGCLPFSRGSPSDNRSAPARFRVASSRCWRSAAG